MTERSLQVTFRKGRPFAAYLHLSHATGEKSAKTLRQQTAFSWWTTAAAVGRSASRSQPRRLFRSNVSIGSLRSSVRPL